MRYPRPADRRSRPQRWRDAVAELVALQADGATAQALQAIVVLDLDDIAAVEPPRGFGRD